MLRKNNSKEYVKVFTEVNHSNHRMHNNLNINEEWNDLIFNSNPDLIFTVDLFGRFTSVNETLCKSLGKKSSEIIGKRPIEIGFSETMSKQMREFDEKVIKSKKIVEDNISTVLPNGKIVISKVTLYPLHDEDGNVNGIGGVVRDITQYHKIEDDLKETKEEFSTIVKNAPDIIAIHSAGKILFINEKGLELFKAKSSDEIIGKPLLHFVHRDFKDIVKERAFKAEKKNQASPAIEEKFIALDGSFIDVEVKSIPTKYQNKNSVLIIARDISERKKAEETVKSERALFLKVLDNIPTSVYVTDMEGKKIFANSSQLKFMGHDSNESIVVDNEIAEHKKIQENISKEDLFVLKTGNSLINKIENLFDDQNKKRNLLTSRVPLKDADNNIIGLVFAGRDITERLKYLEQLNESKDRLHKITMSSTDWVWEVDINGRYTYCSDQIKKILGYEAEDLIGKTPFDLMHKQEAERVGKIFENILMNKKDIVDLENWNVHKDGHDVCLLTNGYPNYDHSGNLIGYIGVDKDITNRKKRDKEIFELNEKLTTLVKLIPFIVMFKDGEGRWLVTNEPAKKRYSLHNIDWYGKTDDELALLQPEFAELHKNIKIQDEKAWASKKKFEFDAHGKLPNGNKYVHRITKVPLFDTEGKRKALLVMIDDISKRKAEEEHLKLLETVITNTTDGVMITDAYPIHPHGTKIIYVNDALLKITGYSREEIIGKTPQIFQGLKTDRAELNRMREAIENAESCEIEVINYKKDGEEFWSNIAISPVLNKEGVPTNWVALTRDTTDAKKQEQKIKKAIIKAQENEKYFIGRELHDNVAQLLFGAMLSMGMVKGDNENDKNWLKQSNEIMHNAFEDLRSLSHSLAPATFKGSNNVFEDTVMELFKSINKENKFKITSSFIDLDKANLTSELKLNLYRILQEQLQNIIKHADATEIEISIKVYDGNLRMRLFDNGKGFDLEATSNGIGLQNIKSRVEIFSGQCTINSSIGNGCEMLIDMPV